jgi:Prp8 binding protein
MQLTGHSGEVFAAKFDPNGNYIASGSMDRTISEWSRSTTIHEF